MKIGYFGFTGLVNNNELNSMASVFDYDIIIVNPNGMIKIYQAFPFYNLKENSSFTTGDYRLHYSNIEQLIKDLRNFADSGKLVVLIMPIRHPIGIHNLTDELNLSPLSFLRENNPPREFSNISGNKVEKNGKDADYNDLISSLSEFISYKSYIIPSNKSDFEPLLYANGTQYILGGKYSDNQLIIPHLEFSPSVMEVLEISLIKYYEAKNKPKHELVLPNWLNDLKFEEEDIINRQLESNTQEISRLESETTKLSQQIKDFEKIKSVLSESGSPFEEAVEFIFRIMGFNIEKGEPGRVDLVIKHDIQPIVIEVKGVSGSSGESQANQLEKWVSIYTETTNTRPKGLLIVNSFKNIPINERDEITFPNQMLNYASSRQHCLMSSIDLLQLYADYSNELIDNNEIYNIILNTVGIVIYKNRGKGLLGKLT